MSARRSGNRSGQRSAMFRRFRVATSSASSAIRRSAVPARSQRPAAIDGARRRRDRDREREGRSPALLGLHAGSRRRGPRRCGARSPARGPSRRRSSASDRPCRSARRSGAGRRRRRRAVVGHPAHEHRRRGRAGRAASRLDRLAPHPDAHLAPGRAELHRVVDEVREDLGEPRGLAAHRRQALVDDDAQRRRPGARRTVAAARRIRSATRPRSTSSRCELAPAALDPGEVEQLGDHLGDVAGLDLELADPLAHLRRHGRRPPRRPSASRASDSTSSPTVVIGVRSSCDRLSMNSARIRWRRRSSATSSSTSQTPRIGERRARTTSVGAVRRPVGERDLAARPARLARLARDRLDPMVAERLDRGPPEHRAGLAAEEHVGRGVGDLDPQVVAQPDDPDADEVGEVGAGRAAAAPGRTRRPRRAGGACAADRSGRRPVGASARPRRIDQRPDRVRLARPAIPSVRPRGDRVAAATNASADGLQRERTR